MNDSFNRNINYARISLTNLCNLNCQYCSKNNGEKQNISTFFYKNLIDVLDEIGIEKIRFTGGEPLLNSNIVELVKYTAKKQNVKDICITTNAILLDKYIDDLVKYKLNRINISLDTIDSKKYFEITGKNLKDKVLENIKLAKNKGLKVKINSVLLKGLTIENIEEFLEFGYQNNIQIRFIELMPIGNNIDYYSDKYLNSNDIISKLDCYELDIYKNDVVTYFRYKDKYDFGIISPISNHFCNTCNRIRITSSGNLRLCLHSDNEIDLLSYKNDKDMLYKIISDNIKKKPEKHLINQKEFAKTNMIQIGG